MTDSLRKVSMYDVLSMAITYLCVQRLTIFQSLCKQTVR